MTPQARLNSRPTPVIDQLGAEHKKASEDATELKGR